MKKKILAAAAVVLAVALCVTGTIAYLTETSNDGKLIVNTFKASDGLIEGPTGDPTDPDSGADAKGFFILEHDAASSDPSALTLSGNDYTVMPGVNLKKDAYVHIKGKTSVPAYVFIEVLDTLDSKLSYDLVDDWKDIDVTLTHEDGSTGAVYAYKKTIDKDLDASILVNNEIVVDKDYDAEDGGALSFNGYICQEAGFEAANDGEFLTKAAAAFNACFVPAESSESSSASSN